MKDFSIIGFLRKSSNLYPHETRVLKIAKVATMKIGYGRVSEKSLNAELQSEALRQAGCTRIFIEHAPARISDRKTPANHTELERCLASLKPGDTLIVWNLDRLGRSIGDLAVLLEDLQRKNVQFVSIAECLDTSTPAGRERLTMVRMLADMQRVQQAEKFKAGRATAVARGVKMGRKPVLSTKQIQSARKMIAEGCHPSAVAKTYHTSLATLYRALKHEKGAA